MTIPVDAQQSGIFDDTHIQNMYVCYHILQSMDQPGKVANAARGKLNRENEYFLSQFAPEALVSRDRFGRPVLRQPAHSPSSD